MPTKFELRLVETGGKLGGSFYGQDAEFHYRWDNDIVCIGRRETFDRWANSRDFVLHRPVEEVDLDVLRHACHLALSAGTFDAGWALEFDLGGYYRRAKREFKKIARITKGD